MNSPITYLRDRGRNGIDKIEDFQDWYSQNFESLELDSLTPVRMFLVGLGVDNITERMVKFLAENSSMDISLLTYHGFDYGGKLVLAKQVEVDSSDDNSGSPKMPRSERWKKGVSDRIEKFGLDELMSHARSMFRENWPQSRELTVTHGINIRLRELINPESSRHTRRAYARIDPAGNGEIGIVFFPRAIELCKDEFNQPVSEIRYRTWPPDSNALEDANTEIQFLLTPEEWEIHKEQLTGLVQSLYKAWQD